MTITIPSTIDSLDRDGLISVIKKLREEHENLIAEHEVLRNEYKLALEDLNRTQDKAKRFEMENAELKAHLNVVQRDAKYTVGLVDGLKFAIRCNGVSGGEVKE